MDTIQKKLEAWGQVRKSVPLKGFTTFRIGGTTDLLFQAKDLENLVEALRFLEENEVPVLILGKGSNVLLSDEDFHGVTVLLSDNLKNFRFDENLLEAEAGCSLIALSFQAMQRALSGLEFASGIPGSVGGGLYMNAGAYKKALFDILEEVLVYRHGKAEWVSKDTLSYGYRTTPFQKQRDCVILAGRFRLEPADKEAIADLMKDRKARREKTQPVSQPCAGSVFRNPQEKPAWKIVDELGLRGLEQGGAKISDLHSNFIVNPQGKASAKDVSSLIDRIRKEAKEVYGIEMIPEIERIQLSEIPAFGQ